MKIYDISMTINQSMQVYKNNPDKKPTITTRASHEQGHVHETRVEMDLHTGTHIDAPLHMIKNGETMECYGLDSFIHVAKVFDMQHVENGISKEHLINLDIQKQDFVLFKTKNSFSEEFLFDFTYLDESGAQYLVEKNINGVGIDGLGIERNQTNHSTHKQLLSKKMMIVEGLRLKEVPEGVYQLIILPLKIANVEASPARAILIANNKKL